MNLFRKTEKTRTSPKDSDIRKDMEDYATFFRILTDGEMGYIDHDKMFIKFSATLTKRPVAQMAAVQNHFAEIIKILEK